MTKTMKILLTLTILTPGTALAHYTEGTLTGSLAGGILHPLTGLDHLLVIVAVGLWAARQPLKLKLGIPVVFALTLAGAGIIAQLSGVGLPYEAGIGMSLLLAGVLLALPGRHSAAWALPLSAALAVSHGWAHGIEMAPHTAAAPYLLGMLMTTAALQLSAIGLFLRFRGHSAGHRVKVPE